LNQHASLLVVDRCVRTDCLFHPGQVGCAGPGPIGRDLRYQEEYAIGKIGLINRYKIVPIVIRAGNTETEVAEYFEKEVELLSGDDEAKSQQEELKNRLDDWAKRFHFHVNMGKTEIVATKKDSAINAEYAHQSSFF
jgi:hypothetical protein